MRIGIFHLSSILTRYYDTYLLTYLLTSSKVCVKKGGTVLLAVIFNIKIASDATSSVQPSYCPVTRKINTCVNTCTLKLIFFEHSLSCLSDLHKWTLTVTSKPGASCLKIGASCLGRIVQGASRLTSNRNRYIVIS